MIGLTYNYFDYLASGPTGDCYCRWMKRSNSRPFWATNDDCCYGRMRTDKEKVVGAPGASGRRRREPAEAMGTIGNGRQRLVKRVAAGTTGDGWWWTDKYDESRKWKSLIWLHIIHDIILHNKFNVNYNNTIKKHLQNYHHTHILLLNILSY
jgi:hypothetical protein